jgi:O-acetyl-ADP-ribose deacetylase
MTMASGLKNFATYQLSDNIKLVLARGSVLDFVCPNHQGAIVNAADEGCLGGGGVDGAISEAGGRNLAKDRESLPVLGTIRNSQEGFSVRVRCQVGSAVLTGPGNYGTLKVNHVIHAVGPNYWKFHKQDYAEAHRLLESAYGASLDLANENGLGDVAFSLLSAGIFRGRCSLDKVLKLGVLSIREWAQRPQYSTVSNVYLVAFTRRECETLQEVCEEVLSAKPPSVE